jgi:multidrug resistance efflux pump
MVFVACLPLPGSVRLAGVLERSGLTVVHAQTAGFLTPNILPPGNHVQHGTRLVQLENQLVDGNVRRLEAEVNRLSFQLREMMEQHQAAAAVTDYRLASAKEKLDAARREQQQLSVRASNNGIVLHALGPQHEQRFVARGEPVATIADGPWLIRCLATSDELARASPRLGDAVRVRLSADAQHEMLGSVQKIAETGSRQVRQPALTQLGGGQIVVRPDTREAAQVLFEIEVRLVGSVPAAVRQGMTARVIFDKHPETLASIIHRRLQQFLHRLNQA